MFDARSPRIHIENLVLEIKQNMENHFCLYRLAYTHGQLTHIGTTSTDENIQNLLISSMTK